MLHCNIGNIIVMKLKHISIYIYICMVYAIYKHIHYLTRTEMKMANAKCSVLRQHKLSKRNCFQAYKFTWCFLCFIQFTRILLFLFATVVVSVCKQYVGCTIVRVCISVMWHKCKYSLFFGWVIKCVRFGKSLRQQKSRENKYAKGSNTRVATKKKMGKLKQTCKKSTYPLFHLYGNGYCHYHYDFTIQFEIFTNYSLF